MLTSSATRDGHGSTLHRFLREYGEHLREYEIHATKGTYEALARTGLFEADRLICHPSGLTGGVVEVASLAVENRFGAIALLLDPTDPFGESPENLALQRACIGNNIPQLMNFGDLAHWIEYEAGRDLDAAPDQLDVAPKEDVVALVAHDGKKREMLEFFARYASFLTRKHAELIATGTTGRLVLELCCGTSYNDLPQKIGKQRLKTIEGDPKTTDFRENWERWLRRLGDWRKEGWYIVEGKPDDQAERVHFRNSADREVVLTLFRSGPDGGDIQIAKRILEGRCNAVLFFHDPQAPHAHDADIRLCIRTCQLPKVTVTLRRDIGSAERWVKGCMLGLRPGLRPAAGVPQYWPKQVLALPARGAQLEGKNNEYVRQLTRTCAGYLDELLHELLSPGVRGRPRRRVLVLVAWGTTVRWIVEALADEELARRGLYGAELLISPMIGLTGEGGKWQLEASAIANDLVALYGGHRLGLASPAFFAGGGQAKMPPDVAKIREKITQFVSKEDCFVVALTTLRPWSPGKGATMRYPEIDAPGAKVELCGLFLDGEGRPVTPRWTPDREEAQTLVPFDLLRSIAESGHVDDRAQRRGEIIVVCGYSETRTDQLARAIRAGVVNTLITDTETRDAAWKAASRSLVRGAARLRQQIPITYRVGENKEWMQSQTMNISDSGVLFGPATLERGTSVEVILSLSIQIGSLPPGKVQCMGEVVHATEARAVGIRFKSCPRPI